MGVHEIPQGVVMVFCNEHGREIANTADFDTSGYGGFTKQQAQTLRARQALARQVVNAYASPDLVRAISTYRCEEIVNELVSQHKCTIHTIAIGYKAEPTHG